MTAAAPMPSLDDLPATCDWGHCDSPTFAWRWSDPHGWLPVCFGHLPQRIQRKRTKGWKMPEDAIYVGRPTRWGNPFAVGDQIMDPVNGWNPVPGKSFGAFQEGKRHLVTFDGMRYTQTVRRVADSADAVALYRRLLTVDDGWDWSRLRGRDLACWCPLDQPCHADVLLELANKP